MGVERTVTLWHLHRQMLLQELASLDAQITQPTQLIQLTQPSPTSDLDVVPLIPTLPITPITPIPLVPQSTDQSELETQRKKTQEKLRALGPCPKPMMG